MLKKTLAKARKAVRKLLPRRPDPASDSGVSSRGTEPPPSLEAGESELADFRADCAEIRRESMRETHTTPSPFSKD